MDVVLRAWVPRLIAAVRGTDRITDDPIRCAVAVEIAPPEGRGRIRLAADLEGGQSVEGVPGSVVEVEQVSAAVVPDDQVGKHVAVDVAQDHGGRGVVLRAERDRLRDRARQVVHGEREPALERHPGHADGLVTADLTGESTAGATSDHEEAEPAVERDEVRAPVAERRADVLREHADDVSAATRRPLEDETAADALANQRQADSGALDAEIRPRPQPQAAPG